jgi:hypothetical protein
MVPALVSDEGGGEAGPPRMAQHRY